MKQPFDELIKNLKNSIADYKYYVDFPKVFENIEKCKIELNILNALIGSDDIEQEFIKIISEYPKVIKVLPILLAVRKKEMLFFDKKEILIKFDSSENASTYCNYMKETGLFDILQNRKIKSIVDYVTGVEAGMDTNGRKNRTGITMQNIVEGFIKEIPDIIYHKEMKKHKITTEYNIDLNKMVLGESIKKDADKRFDFVVKTKNHLYLIETNFYSTHGSKLNETARSYKSIANDIEKLDSISFMWITDGIGWKNAKGNLRETYDIMEHIYTLTDLENNILFDVLK